MGFLGLSTRSISQKYSKISMVYLYLKIFVKLISFLNYFRTESCPSMLYLVHWLDSPEFYNLSCISLSPSFSHIYLELDGFDISLEDVHLSHFDLVRNHLVLVFNDQVYRVDGERVLSDDHLLHV